MNIELTDEEKKKYKGMSIEEIVEDIKTRTDAQNLTECAIWIKNKCTSKNNKAN